MLLIGYWRAVAFMLSQVQEPPLFSLRAKAHSALNMLIVIT